MTIPNLELQAAVYSAQLPQFVMEEQNIDFTEIIFWSDRTTVLYWLRTLEMRHRIFFAKRWAKILAVSYAFDWRYNTSIANPADDETRGYSAYQMKSESGWNSGQSFLSRYRLELPKQEILQSQYAQIVSFPSLLPVLETVVTLTKFSSWNRLIRVIAFSFYFAGKCRKRTNENQLAHHTKAYLLIIQTTQEEDFKAEFFALKKGFYITSSSRLKLLSPIIDKTNDLELEAVCRKQIFR